MTVQTIFEGLSPEHERELMFGSDITTQVISERYYQTVTASELPDWFADYQRRDGLSIPLWNVHGELASFQLKPNQPRLGKSGKDGKQGKPIKYETAANRPQVLDVPRRCTKLLANPKIPLWITEGAKKVDSALSNGIECIIGLQGVYGWRGTGADGGKTVLPDWESIALNDREVVLAFDSDVKTNGDVRRALDRLSAFLGSRGAKVKFLHMPDLEDGAKCGLDDWFARGRNLLDLQQYIVDPVATVPDAPEKHEKQENPMPMLQVIGMDEVEEEEVIWLWPGWIPRGMFTILGGYGGDGKSTLMTSLIGAFSRGGLLPDGARAPKINCMMLCAEDDINRAVKPRLRLHDANMSSVKALTGMVGEGTDARWMDIRKDIEQLKMAIRAYNIGLLVLDPLSSFTPRADRNNEGDVRDALQPLLLVAEECDVAIVGIMHIGKSTDSRPAAMKLLGSTAFTALARSVMMVAELPKDQQPEDADVIGKHKIVEVVKSNYAVPPQPLAFSRPLDAAVQWLGTSTVHVSECYGGSSNRGPEPEERKDAEAFLREYLADGPRPSKDVMAEAKLLGLSERTLRTAKALAGVSSQRLGREGSWNWYLGRPKESNVA